MNIFRTTLSAVILLFSFVVNASTLSFTSGMNDLCLGSTCTITGSTKGSWVDPTDTVLDGASWIQINESWYIDNSNYSIYEVDFSDTTNYVLISLFVSYDDDLTVSFGDTVIFDSTTISINHAWASIVDVFDYINTDSLITSSPKPLTFTVVNSAGNGTGVIWSGTAASVPEPSMVFALGLGLFIFGFKRSRNNKA